MPAAWITILAVLASVACLGAGEAPPRDRLDLAGTWRVQPVRGGTAPASDVWATAAIPGNLVVDGGWRVGRRTEWPADLVESPGNAWLERAVAVPAAWAGRRIVLTVDEVELDAVVHIDGRRVGEILNPGGELDLTGAVRPGAECRIAIHLTRTYEGVSRPAAEDPLHALAWGDAFRRYARLALGPIALRALPAAGHVAAVVAVPSCRTRSLGLEVDVEAARALPGARLAATVRGPDGAVALAFTSAPLDLPAGASRQAIASPWADPRLWDLGDPHLYTCTVALQGADGAVIDPGAPITFGFRETWLDGRTIMMNGHPCRWRLHWRAESAQGMQLLLGMGFNVFQIQPNPEWSSFSRFGTLPGVEADAAQADAQGYGLTAPAVVVNRWAGNLLTNPRLQAQYRVYQERHIRRLRNHPSILAWGVSMNFTSSPPDQAFPHRLGRRRPPQTKGADGVIEWATAGLHAIDPTRPVFGHCGGATADIHTRNAYLDWLPLAECENWLSAWAASADAPWGAVEFGTPYVSGDFFHRGDGVEQLMGGIPRTAGVPLVAEYCAMRLGDRAYALEGDGHLAGLTELARKAGPHGAGFAIEDTPVMPVLAESARRITRAWRTWGLAAGALPWTFGIGYGGTPSGGWAKGLFLYKDLAGDPGSFRQRPSWANGLYDAYRATQQPFLAWLSGPPGRFVARDHQVVAGGALERGIALVWDGPRPVEAVVRWEVRQGDRRLAGAELHPALAPGDIRILPLRIAAPAVDRRSELTVVLRAEIPGQEPQEDRLTVAAHPAPPTPPLAAVQVVDPAGATSAALRRLGVEPRPLAAGARPRGMLVVGRKALAPGQALPFTAAEVEAGLQVLVCEQDGAVLDALGLRSSDAAAREVFVRQAGSPLLAGLTGDDLCDWNGASSVLPETGPARSTPDPHGYHWGNHGTVAGAVIETPHAGAFAPVLECGFDLAYSPLLTWRHGRGAVTFCQLEVSERAAAGDPVPGRLLANLVAALAAPARTSSRRAELLAGPAAGALVAGLGLAVEPVAAPSGDPARILVVAPGGEAALAGGKDAVARLLSAGGTVVLLGVEPGAALPVAIAGAWAECQRAARAVEDHPLLAGVGPGLVRWRTPLRTWRAPAAGLPAGAVRLLDGALLDLPVGDGWVVVSGIDPLGCDLDAQADAHQRAVARLSAWRLRRLHAQLLANVGVAGDARWAQALATPMASAADQPVDLVDWEVAGPFANPDARGGGAPGRHFAVPLAPERDAEAAAYQVDGRRIAWRRSDDPELRPAPRPGNTDTVVARTDGYLDLEPLRPQGDGVIVYARTTVRREAAGEIELSLGCDWWATVWVNGVQVYTTGPAGGAARPRAIPFRAAMKAGDNRVLVKVASGRNGFGLWLSRREAAVDAAAESRGRPAFYAAPLQRGDDPLTFVNW